MSKTGISLALAFAALTVGLAPTAAHAGDSSSTWAGPYIGLNVGYAWSDTDWAHESGNPYSNQFGGGPITVAGEKFSADGAIGGGQIGYNFQFNRLIAGVEVSYSKADLQDSHDITAGAFVAPPSTVETKIDSLVTLTGRLGYAFDDRWMAYVKGGYAGGKVQVKGFDASGANFNFDNREWADGWTIGGGAEFKLSSALSLAVEYMYVDLGTKTIVGQITNLPNFPAQIGVDPTIDIVTVRLNYRFPN